MHYKYLDHTKLANALIPEEDSGVDVEQARRFLMEIDRLNKDYGLSYFVVTDGASATRHSPTRTRDNEAVIHARGAHKEWERQHGIDPDHDWAK